MPGLDPGIHSVPQAERRSGTIAGQSGNDDWLSTCRTSHLSRTSSSLEQDIPPHLGLRGRAALTRLPWRPWQEGLGFRAPERSRHDVRPRSGDPRAGAEWLRRTASQP
jgi:hypothetical protein